MTEQERKEATRELHGILDSMNLPSFRTQQMNESNLLWLQRNVGINNGAHPDIHRVDQLIRKLLKK